MAEITSQQCLSPVFVQGQACIQMSQPNIHPFLSILGLLGQMIFFAFNGLVRNTSGGVKKPLAFECSGRAGINASVTASASAF